MARNDPQVNFRIPAELNERIKASAAENNRTITAELVHRLEASFDETKLTAEQVKRAEHMMALMSNLLTPTSKRGGKTLFDDLLKGKE